MTDRLRRLLIALTVYATAAVQSAAAAPCKPPQSAAMLTGPVYDAITAECAWVDALNRRDAAAAGRLLDPSFTRVDAAGAVRRRGTVLSRVGGLGTIGVSAIDVPFSAGSTNVVTSMWTFGGTQHRVTDVFFCNIRQTCSYRLISEQFTRIAR